MARIRTIKPEIWSDEKLSECSLSAHLLFIGLFCFADDEGRMEYAPARLRMQIFPCGRVPQKKLIEHLGELTERSLIHVYQVDGKEYLFIPGFVKHQKINRPTPSKIPPFHGVLSESSVSPHAGMEWKGKEGKGSKSAPAALTHPIGIDLDAWMRWLEYRKGIGKPIKPVSAQAAIDEFAKFGKDQAAVVQQSIAAGYTGLFALKAVNGTKSQPFVAPPDEDEEPQRAQR